MGAVEKCVASLDGNAVVVHFIDLPDMGTLGKVLYIWGNGVAEGVLDVSGIVLLIDERGLRVESLLFLGKVVFKAVAVASGGIFG